MLLIIYQIYIQSILTSRLIDFNSSVVASIRSETFPVQFRLLLSRLDVPKLRQSSELSWQVKQAQNPQIVCVKILNQDQIYFVS